MAIPTTVAEAVKLFGLPRGADAAAVRKRYRELAKQHHPDTNPNDPLASQQMAALNAARDMLKNGVPTAQQAAPPPRPQPAPQRPPPTRAEREETHEAFRAEMRRARRNDVERDRRRRAARTRSRREAEARAQRDSREQAHGRREAHPEHEAERPPRRRPAAQARRTQQAPPPRPRQAPPQRAQEAPRPQQAPPRRARQSPPPRPKQAPRQPPPRPQNAQAESGAARGPQRAGRSGAAIERAYDALKALGWGSAVAAARRAEAQNGSAPPGPVEVVLSVSLGAAAHDAAAVVISPSAALSPALLERAIAAAERLGAPYAFAVNGWAYRRANLRRRTRTQPQPLAQFPNPEQLRSELEQELAAAEPERAQPSRQSQRFGRLF